MKLFKLIGHVLGLSATLASAVAADGDEGRKISPTEAGDIASKTVGLILDAAPALSTDARLSLASALRSAASRLESGAL